MFPDVTLHIVKKLIVQFSISGAAYLRSFHLRMYPGLLYFQPFSVLTLPSDLPLPLPTMTTEARMVEKTWQLP